MHAACTTVAYVLLHASTCHYYIIMQYLHACQVVSKKSEDTSESSDEEEEDPNETEELTLEELPELPSWAVLCG